MGSLYLWGRSILEMRSDVVIGCSIYGVAVIDGSLYSRFYGIHLLVTDDITMCIYMVIATCDLNICLCTKYPPIEL